MVVPTAPGSGAVLVGVVPQVSGRVLDVAAEYARLHATGLVVAYVDVTRFVTYQDPDGTTHSTAIDVNLAAAEDDLQSVRATAEARFAATDLEWEVSSLVGDPASALSRLADTVSAPLIVVGTRHRGLGESIREFFTGSVAARLTHRQQRPVLVVPAPPRDEDYPQPAAAGAPG
jgi:nucleotide-binding universal stress UspA family protein